MISIIIPVLNESLTVQSLLKHLIIKSSGIVDEICIVDGGSIDDTQQLVRNFSKELDLQPLKNGVIKFPNIVLLTSQKGRAKQMNTGAAAAGGEILYFLHADSFPPKDFDALIIQEIKKGNPAGCFKMKFDSNHWWLRLASYFTKYSWRACRGGDQSQFITRTLFEEIGGYDETFVIYEDNILINELYERNKFVVIQHWLVSSARLYREKGVWNLQYHFLKIYIKRWLGADADELYAYYVNNIKSVKKNKPIEEQFSRKEVVVDK